MQMQQQWLGQVRWIGQGKYGEPPCTSSSQCPAGSICVNGACVEQPTIEGKLTEQGKIQYKPWPTTPISPAAAQAAIENTKRDLATERSIQRALSPTEKILLASVIISAIGLLYSIFGRRR